MSSDKDLIKKPDIKAKVSWFESIRERGCMEYQADLSLNQVLASSNVWKIL